MNAELDDSGLKSVQDQLRALEARIGRLEKLYQAGDSVRLVSEQSGIQEQDDPNIQVPFKTNGSIEFGLGEYGMAWLGNIVLLFGITFLVQNLLKNGNVVMSLFSGYFAVALIYTGAHFTSKAYSYLSKLLQYNAHIILFIITLRLHFFQAIPVISNPAPALALLFLISAFLFVFAYRKRIQFLSGLSLVMVLFIGMVSNSTHIMLSSVVVVSTLSLLLYSRFKWIRLIYVFIALSYFVYLNWLLNNPIMTGEAVFREVHHSGITYLFLTALVFSLAAIVPKEEKLSGDWVVVAIIWNGLAFTGALALTVVAYYLKNYVLIFSCITLFSLVFSVILKRFSHQEITASLYAIYGFVAMSISIYGLFLFPKAYLLLAVQSFLVVSMALWFRSRFLVITNTLLFLLILIFYIIDPADFTATDFTFMLVAFITARVMNWKKNRLQLKTEFIRNLYLTAGFAMTLIAFYNVVPKSFVTVSWIGAALLFFSFGYMIKNIKYRWLAIASMLASAIYLVFIDMKNMDISFRILVFLLLAVISITVSIIYTRFLRHRKDLNSEPDVPSV